MEVPSTMGAGHNFYPLLKFSLSLSSKKAGGNNGNLRVWLSHTQDLVVSICAPSCQPVPRDRTGENSLSTEQGTVIVIFFMFILIKEIP